MTTTLSNLDDNGEDRIAFVQACWHREIVDQARDAFLASIEGLGYARSQVDLFEVPGHSRDSASGKTAGSDRPLLRDRGHSLCR